MPADLRGPPGSGRVRCVHELPPLLQEGSFSATYKYAVLLSGLLRPLLEREWARQVAQWNRLEHSSLESFLFGRDRIPTESVRGDLCELQQNRCFYCGAGMGRKAVVDHFLPWARYPNNAIENLVAADEACNGSKRDFLVASDHVSRWRARAPGALSGIARSRQWESAGERTESVVRTLYLRLPEGARLWQGRGVFVPAAQALLKRAFGPAWPGFPGGSRAACRA